MNIEKNIPTPEGSGSGRPAKYPFTKMEVGDSVFIAGGRQGCNELNAAKVYANRTGKRFSSRTVDGGLRIWRIE